VSGDDDFFILHSDVLKRPESVCSCPNGVTDSYTRHTHHHRPRPTSFRRYEANKKTAPKIWAPNFELWEQLLDARAKVRPFSTLYTVCNTTRIARHATSPDS
jgi:hypothetical protein